MLIPQSAIKFFKASIKINEHGCWIWQRGMNGNDYGYIWFNGRQMSCHRFSWLIHRGDIPKGVFVCHNCPVKDNPSCCNPDHLWLGTPSDNTLDAVKKGTVVSTGKTFNRLWKTTWKNRRGELHKDHKLTNVQVIEMRRLHEHDGWGYKKLRNKFGVSCMVAKRIVKRMSWKHI